MAAWEEAILMLEPATSRQINQLIRKLCQHHEKALESDAGIVKEDMDALSSLINAVSVPDPIGPANAIGFVQDSSTDDGDDE